jgi:hypothetical protein
MKKTILALALTAAAVPFTFAAQTAAPAQNSSSASKSASKTTTKKSHKKAVKKSTQKSGSPASTAPAGK